MRGCACRGTSGFAHVSCLAEQAKILVAEAIENRLADELNVRWQQWNRCSLCEQEYHGVVSCALGWACWKTYLGRPEEDSLRRGAMNALANGLGATKHHEDSLSVKEAQLSMMRRIGAPEESILVAQGNLAITYGALGRPEALQMKQDVYNGNLKLNGEEHGNTLMAASNYTNLLLDLRRFEEARSLLRKMIPVALASK